MTAGGFVRVFIFIGLIVLLTSSVTGATPAAWTAISAAAQSGVTWPTFWNPFTEEIVRETSFIDAPFNFSSNSGGSIVGCVNSSGGIPDCLRTPDRDESYVRIPILDDSLDATFTSFNWTNPRFLSITGNQLREVVVTVMCMTEAGESTTGKAMVAWNTWLVPWTGVGTNNTFFIDCPKGSYQNVVARSNFPAGLEDCQANCTPFDSNDHDYNGNFFANDQTGPLTLNSGNPVIRVTYLRLDIAFSSAGDCIPPEGAWFPVFDQIACTIIAFANFVWKGLQFIASGIAFLVLSLATVTLFIGNIVVSFFIGLIEVYAVLFGLGAPSPAQEFIDLVALSSIGYLLFTIVSVARGTEG